MKKGIDVIKAIWIDTQEKRREYYMAIYAKKNIYSHHPSEELEWYDDHSKTCTCAEECDYICHGECGCEKCKEDYEIFLSDETEKLNIQEPMFTSDKIKFRLRYKF